MEREKNWKKVLYINQCFPDNYVQTSFLHEMEKNVNIKTYQYWNIVKETGMITQQLCSVCLFVVLFIYMDSGLLDPNYLILILVCIVLVCYASRSIIEKKGKYKGRDIQTMLIFLTLAFGLSPVLQTLTETISTDTIYAMTVFMLLSNVLFHNYRVNEPISRSLSLNASVFASVCLASRFNSRMHAFATVTLALLIFALWPEIRKTLEVHVRGAAPIMTLSSITTALIALYSVSSMAALLFSLVIITFTFLIPLWLIRLQPSKNNIHGPWDEAVIQ